MLNIIYILTIGVLLPECSLIKTLYGESSCCDSDVTNVESLQNIKKYKKKFFFVNIFFEN